MRRTSVIYSSLLVALCSTSAMAAGPYIGDLDPVGIGQAGAFVASPSTTAAFYYNPAALAGQGGLRIQAEFGFSLAQMDYLRAPDGTTTFGHLHNREPFQPAFLAGLTYDFKVPGLAVGLAAWTPMSNQFGYTDTGPNRYQYIRADNAVIHMHLGAAYQLFSWLSVGATVGDTYFATLQRLAISAALAGDPEDPNFSVPLQLDVADPFTITSNFGVRVTPTDFLDIGLSFTPPYDVDAPGKAKVELPQTLSSLVKVQGEKVNLRLNLPFIFRGGVRVRVHPRLSLELAAVWEAWSRYQKVEVVPQISLIVGTQTLPLPTIVLNKNYKDAVSVRLGGDVRIFDWLQARGGAWLETAAVQPSYFDLSTPDALKFGLALGVSGRIWDGIYLDASYAHIFPQVVNVTATKSQVASLVPGSAATPKPMGNGRYDFSYDLLHFGVRVTLFEPPPAPVEPASLSAPASSQDVSAPVDGASSPSTTTPDP